MPRQAVRFSCCPWTPGVDDLATRETIATFEPRLSRLEGAYAHLATKEDIANVKVGIANVKVDIADARTDIANLKTHIAGIEGRLLRWTVAAMGVGFGITIAILKLI